MTTTTQGPFVQDVTDRVQREFDWSVWLAAGETITAHNLTPADGLTVDGDSHTDTAVTFFATAATPGRYTVACQITTSSDERRTARVTISVRGR